MNMRGCLMSDLFTKHEYLVRSTASSFFQNPADEDDAVQEAYIRLAEIGVVPDVENEAGWVRVILLNLFRDLYKKDRRMRELDQQAAIFEDIDENDPQMLALMLEEDSEYLRTLDDMPTDLAETARLYYTRGMSYRQIAEELNIPEGTVASRLNSARQYFQGYRV
jgi:RNA polymerase sigma-70 factor (ECF subfamily)